MLSIIIPTLNEEKYLPLLLDSIRIQDFKDYEIIVADAGSKDGTITIAQKYGCRLVKGGLLSIGRNNGAKAAKGDMFLFLDADVVLPAFFLKSVVEKFKKEKVGIAGFPILPLHGKKIDVFAHKFLNKFSQLTQKVMPYATAAILARSDVHKMIGGFDEEIVFVEDYPYAKAASKVAKYQFMKEYPFYTSVRRYEKDGRFNVYSKYILAQLHMLFLGPVKSDIFKYKFNHYYKDEK